MALLSPTYHRKQANHLRGLAQKAEGKDRKELEQYASLHEKLAAGQEKRNAAKVVKLRP